MWKSTVQRPGTTYRIDKLVHCTCGDCLFLRKLTEVTALGVLCCFALLFV